MFLWFLQYIKSQTRCHRHHFVTNMSKFNDSVSVETPTTSIISSYRSRRKRKVKKRAHGIIHVRVGTSSQTSTQIQSSRSSSKVSSYQSSFHKNQLVSSGQRDVANNHHRHLKENKKKMLVLFFPISSIFYFIHSIVVLDETLYLLSL